MAAAVAALASLAPSPGVRAQAPGPAAASVSGFAMDLDGNGSIDPSAEVFDLSLVADAATSSLQFFRLAPGAAPRLIAVVRLPAPPTAVRIDADQRLARVALGSAGVMLVDLAGPASLQPIDLDRDGTDDRLLGLADTPGQARAASDDLRPGIAVLADGGAGISTAQLSPSRVRLIDLRRDPVLTTSRDDLSILTTRRAFASDAGVTVVLDSAFTADTPVSITVDEVPEVAGQRLVRLENDRSAVSVPPGRSETRLRITAGALGRVAVRARTDAGQVVAFAEFRIVDPPAVSSALIDIEVSPPRLALSVLSRTGQLGVGARYASGEYRNVTRGAEGTTYRAQNPLVATVDADGRVTARAGGATTIAVTHAGRSRDVLVQVNGPATLETLESEVYAVAFTAIGDAQVLDVLARFTDGSLRAAAGEGATFQSDDEGVVTVDAAGRLVATGAGATSVLVRLAGAAWRVPVVVEPRTGPAFTALALDPPAGPVSTDLGEAKLTGRATGTGSVQGVPVELVVDGRRADTTTAYDGTFILRVTGLRQPGLFSATASLVDPATGATLQATTSLEVVRQGEDAEPNDGLASAVPVAIRPVRVPVSGRVGGGDASDSFRVTRPTAGTLSARVTFGAGAPLDGVLVRIVAADGTELARGLPVAGRALVAAALPAGPAFVDVAGGSAEVSYSLVLDFEQAPVVVTGAAPLSGGPGAVVTIAGSGFDPTPGATRVYFGAAEAEVQGVTATSVVAVVPALAVDGALRVVSGAGRGEGPAFSVGRAGPPEIRLRPPDPAFLRVDPLSGALVNVSRVAVFARPATTPAQAEALAASLGGTLAGVNAVTACYYFEFTGHRGLEDLTRTATALAASPLVRRALPIPVELPARLRLDATALLGSKRAAFDAARTYEALDLVRRTPPFDAPGGLGPARVAVIDTGFNPVNTADYLRGATSVVDYRAPDANGVWVSSPPADPQGHGTAVTSIIAALNDGSSRLSGVMGGLFNAAEGVPGPIVRTFGVGHPLDGGLIDTALASIAASADIDAVNLSFGSSHIFLWQVAIAEFFYESAFQALAGRTLIVPAAANDGTDAAYSVPASLSLSMPHVLTIGASAAINSDGTGERGDARAVFGGQIPLLRRSLACDPANPVAGSNCGLAVGLAAPGEDYQVSVTPTATNASRGCSAAVPCLFNGVSLSPAERGTSYAAPLVTGAAGLVQWLQRAGRLSPTALKAALLDSATDISATWNPGTMGRLDVLNAVRPFLPNPDYSQRVLVADEEADAGGDAPGALVGLDARVDSSVVGAFDSLRLPMQATVDGVTVTATRPSSLVMSPAGSEAYVLARAVSPALGDGVLVFDTLLERFVGFMPLSGAPVLPTAGGGPAMGAVNVPDARTPMVVTPDARLLYVGVGPDLLVFNLVDRRRVRSLAELPAPYNFEAFAYPLGELESRLTAVRAALDAGGPPATKIAALAISQGGTRLLAAVQTGNGPGLQPGRLASIDVGLYTDLEPATIGLQPALANFLSVVGVSPIASGGQEAGDEPSGVAVDGTRGFTYMTNGGLERFSIIPASGEQFALGLSFFGTVDLEVLSQLTDVGGTLIGARGFTAAFGGGAGAPTPELAFPSEVNFGYNSSARLVTQFNRPTVFAKRPFGITLRRDGKRALVPFFQTGNFGVMDLDRQAVFAAPPADGTQNPALVGAPLSRFNGLVGVTPSLALDSHLWPRRGRLPLGGSNYVPSPDEALLFPGPIVYAQNSRFAVASHVGVGRPRTVSFTMPQIASLETQAALDALGLSLAPGQTIDLRRGGSAISVIDDAGITAGLQRAATPISDGTVTRPALAVSPVCAQSAPDGRCITSAVTPKLTYPLNGGEEPFVRARGVGVQPFVYIESPRVGDHVSASTPVRVEWRDPEVTDVGFLVYDLDGPAGPQLVGSPIFPLSAPEQSTLLAVYPFEALLDDPAFPPVAGHRYRIDAGIFKSGGSTQERVSSVEVVVRFDPQQSLRLTPELTFFSVVPSAGPRSLTLLLSKPDGTFEEVSGDAATGYEWIGAGLNEADLPGLADARQAVQQALGLPPPATLGIAQIQVTGGSVSAITPGIQAIRATHPDAQAPSNVSMVLVGFDLAGIQIEPRLDFGAAAVPVVDQLQFVAENPPMVLAPGASALAPRNALASLARVSFGFLGLGRVSASLLFDVVATAASPGFAIADDAEATDRMIALAGGFTGPSPMQYVARDPDVATLTCPPGEFAPSAYTACVGSADEGLGLVGGTLDLTEVGLSTATDDLLVLVLPQVQGGEIVPQPLVIERSTLPVAGPVVQTLSCLGPVDATFALPAGYANVDRFVASWLPTGWGTGPLPVTLTFFDGFSLSMRGQLSTTSFDAGYAIDRFCLSVPVDPVPGVTASDYQQLGPTLVDVTRVDAFSSRLEHRGVVGTTTLTRSFALDGLGAGTASAPLAVCCPPSSLGGGPIITEMNLTPRRDWNDTSGGNGVPFDALPGDGAVTPADVWIELSSLTTPIASWRVRLTDSTGATFTQVIGQPSFTAQTRLLTGWNLGAAPVVRVEILDDGDVARQTLDIVAIEQALGPATGADDETLTWSISGSPTPVLQQFVRRPATINQFAPF